MKIKNKNYKNILVLRQYTLIERLFDGKMMMIENKSKKNILKEWVDFIYYFEDSKYFLVKDKKKYAIFNINKPDNPISKWWRLIYIYGILKNQNEYYIAQRNDKKYAIFHINNSDKPVLDWTKNITKDIIDDFGFQTSFRRQF